MDECRKRGCRNLSTRCDDCDRTVCTKTLDPNDWYDIGRYAPGDEAPCEYKIIVTCRGWYKPNGDEPRFYPDDRHPPTSEFHSWREWKEGPTLEEGAKLVKKFREEKIAEGLPHDGGPTA